MKKKTKTKKDAWEPTFPDDFIGKPYTNQLFIIQSMPTNGYWCSFAQTFGNIIECDRFPDRNMAEQIASQVSILTDHITTVVPIFDVNDLAKTRATMGCKIPFSLAEELTNALTQNEEQSRQQVEKALADLKAGKGESIDPDTLGEGYGFPYLAEVVESEGFQDSLKRGVEDFKAGRGTLKDPRGLRNTED